MAFPMPPRSHQGMLAPRIAICCISVRASGGWGEQRLATGTRNRSEQIPKNVLSPSRPVQAMLGGSSLVYAITEENHAIAKAAFIQKFKLQSNIIGKGLFAASHYNWHEKQMVLIDQS